METEKEIPESSSITSRAKTPIIAVSLLAYHFASAARQKAYPEIDFQALLEEAQRNKTCPVMPRTDEPLHLTWPEIRSMQQAELDIKKITTVIKSGQLYTDKDWERLQKNYISFCNANVAAFIRKIGLNETIKVFPEELHSDQNLLLLEENGWTLLKSVALTAKAMNTLSPQ